MPALEVLVNFEKGLPELSADLIKQLDKIFQHKCPKPEDKEKYIWMYAGKRELIDTLLYLLEEQQK